MVELSRLAIFVWNFGYYLLKGRFSKLKGHCNVYYTCNPCSNIVCIVVDVFIKNITVKPLL